MELEASKRSRYPRPERTCRWYDFVGHLPALSLDGCDSPRLPGQRSPGRRHLGRHPHPCRGERRLFVVYMELRTIGLYVARGVAVAIMLLGLVNGTAMLISPRRWFALPRWLRARGTLRTEQYSTGFGSLELRVLGAITVAAILWVAYSLFFRPLRMQLHSLGLYIGSVLIAIAILLMLINAVLMLLSPRRWFALPGWLRAKGTLTRERYESGWGAIQLRAVGALILASLIWAAHAFFAWTAPH
jgi:hypothetical protein